MMMIMMNEYKRVIAVYHCVINQSIFISGMSL